MATPVELRCPRCGQQLTAYTAYPAVTSYTRCPHCGTVLPFVGPRDPAPLYTWEVYPGLYPPTPVPTPPSARRRPAVLALLLAATLLLASLGGIYAWFGGAALEPGTLTVGGSVFPLQAPGAWVLVQGENGFSANVSVTDGEFMVSHVPYGGIVVTAGANGYQDIQLQLFFSPVYSSVTGSLQKLEFELAPYNGSSATVIDTTEFPDLESFVASVWSGTGLLWIGALFTGLGLVAARRDKIPLVVVGGATAIVAPFAVPLLGIDVVSETLAGIGLVALPVGVVVLLLVLPQFVRSQPPVEPI